MSESKKNPKREELDPKDCWRLEDLYASDQTWEDDAQAIRQQLADFAGYQGKLGESSRSLFDALKAQDALLLRMERLYVYASQKSHQDMGNSHYQRMADQAQALMVQVNDATSFVEPELLEISAEDWERFLKEEPGLALYKRYMEEKQRKKAHILSKEMEGVLAKVSEIGQSPQNIFTMFNNADLKFGTIRDGEGREQELTHGRYVQFLENPDRRVRREAFEKLRFFPPYPGCHVFCQCETGIVFCPDAQLRIFQGGSAERKQYSFIRLRSSDRSRPQPFACHAPVCTAAQKGVKCG